MGGLTGQRLKRMYGESGYSKRRIIYLLEV